MSVSAPPGIIRIARENRAAAAERLNPGLQLRDLHRGATATHCDAAISHHVISLSHEHVTILPVASPA